MFSILTKEHTWASRDFSRVSYIEGLSSIISSHISLEGDSISWSNLLSSIVAYFTSSYILALSLRAYSNLNYLLSFLAAFLSSYSYLSSLLVGSSSLLSRSSDSDMWLLMSWGVKGTLPLISLYYYWALWTISWALEDLYLIYRSSVICEMVSLIYLISYLINDMRHSRSPMMSSVLRSFS